MSELYAIIDLDGYVTQIREAAAKSISDSNEDNLDDYISLNQIIGLVNERCKGFDEENRPLLDEATNELVFEDTAIWIHEVGLAKLAAQDLVECAWDDESNEMIFWRKETKESTQNAKPKSRRKNKKSEG